MAHVKTGATAANFNALAAPFRERGMPATLAPDFLSGAPPEFIEAVRQVAVAALADCQTDDITLASVSFESNQLTEDDGSPERVDMLRLRIRASSKTAAKQLLQLSDYGGLDNRAS